MARKSLSRNPASGGHERVLRLHRVTRSPEVASSLAFLYSTPLPAPALVPLGPLRSDACFDEMAQQLAQERLVTAIAQRIRSSLDLETILQSTVGEIRQFLQGDRVLICQFLDNGDGAVVAESVTPPWTTMMGVNFQDTCFGPDYVTRYPQGRTRLISDIDIEDLSPCHFQFLKALQVRANLVIPIVAEQALWGLLIVHRCREPGEWQPMTIELLQQLTAQVGMAIVQAERHRHVNACNLDLEAQVRERTAKLQQALDFEALVRRITEKMRDSLDESHVLQAVVQELATGLQVDRCKVELYDSSSPCGTIAYEYTTTNPLCQGLVCSLGDVEINAQGLHQQPIQFTTPITPPSSVERSEYTTVTRLTCPIFDAQGTLGILGLVRPQGQVFDVAEVGCVQLVASQCAIAIRQARLYATSQQQVQALERLVRLKDEFLMGISHALQTPLSGIHLATQTLDHLLHTPRPVDAGILDRTLRILQTECQRESRLVNNLLTIAYADGGELLAPQPLLLSTWLPSLIAPWHDRMAQRHQALNLAISPNLPPFQCDPVYLERILHECLMNAYQYTPTGGAIAIEVERQDLGLAIRLSNLGVEIPAAAQPHIFERFYRLPSGDIWESGGAGLGLTVVQKLMERLGGQVQVWSQAGQTCFTLYFPRT